jgi:hypothetical protein
MVRTILLAVALCFIPSIAEAQYPFNYSRSTRTYQGTIYYGRSGQIVGRSFNTPNRTYYSNSSGRMLGSSFSTRSGNTYFNRSYKYSPYSYKNRDKR